MKNIAAGIIMATAVIALNASQERTQRRIDELHRIYQGRIQEARQEGYDMAQRQYQVPPIVELPRGIDFTPMEDAKPKGFRSRFTR